MESVLGTSPATRQSQFDEEQDPAPVATVTRERTETVSSSNTDDDDALSYFARLAEED